MDAFVAVVTNRNQLEEEFVSEVGVGQVMDLGRRPRAAALTDALRRASAPLRACFARPLTRDRRHMPAASRPTVRRWRG